MPVSCAPDQQAKDQRFQREPPTTSLSLITLPELLTELRETLMFTSLLKGMLKDTDE